MKKQIVFSMVAATAATSIFTTANQASATTLIQSTLNVAGPLQLQFIPSGADPSFPPTDGSGLSISNILFANPGSSINKPAGPALSSGTATLGNYANVDVPTADFDFSPINTLLTHGPTGIGGPGFGIKSFNSSVATVPAFLHLQGMSGEDFVIDIEDPKLTRVTNSTYSLFAQGHAYKDGVEIGVALADFEFTLNGLRDNGNFDDLTALDGITGLGSYSGTIRTERIGSMTSTPEPSYILGLGGVAILGALSRKQKRQ